MNAAAPDGDTPLANALLGAVRESAREALPPPAALEAQLVALCEKAEADWPTLELPRGSFVRHLGARLATDDGPPRPLGDLFASDLYLAFGCSVGATAALAAFERHYMPQVTAYLRRSDALPGFADDFKQQLRARLLLSHDALVPKVAAYGGRGPLGAWLRVAAARLAINLRKTARPADLSLSPDDEAQIHTAVPDPELAAARSRYGPIVRDAVAAALAGLGAREATVLRLYFLQSMTHEAIAAVLRVSQRTVRRCVAETRERIIDETKRRLAQKLDASTTQVDSILRLARDELGPSVIAFLKEEAP